MCNSQQPISFRKRSFARFMAKDDDLSFYQYKDKKELLFQEVQGTVLEIGPGTGVNFRFFPNNIEWMGLEPNLAMHPYLHEESKKWNFPISLSSGSSEEMDLASDSMDYVVSTIVLCSVQSVSATLKEILRVLKPGGKFIFLEHQADTPWSVRWMIQKMVPYTPWKYFSDGCTPGRELGKAIEQAGFDTVFYQGYMQQGKGIILEINRPHIYGWAQKGTAC